MSTPQPRGRNTRNSARASQTPVPVTAGTRARTPRGRGNAQPTDTPLPAVPNGQSFAYGAAGPVNIDTQVNTAATTLTGRLNQARGIPTAPSSVAGRAGAAGRKTVTQPSPTPEVEEDEASDEVSEEYEVQAEGGDAVNPSSARRNDDHYSLTDINENMSYVAPHQYTTSSSVRGPVRFREAAAVSYVQTPQQQSQRRVLNPPATPEELRAAQPRPPRILYEAVPRFLRENAKSIRGLFGVALLVCGMMLVLQFVPALNRTIHNLIDSIEERAEYARNITRNGTIFDPSLFDRINKVEDEVGNLRMQFSQFKEMFPDQVVLTKDSTTGELEIPDSFYSAFLSRFRRDDAFKVGESEAWDRFIQANSERLESLSSVGVKNHVNTLLESGVIVSRDTFTHTLDQHVDKLFDKLGSLMRHHESQASRVAASEASAVASSVASQVAARKQPSSGAKYIEDLTLLTFAQNLDLQQQRNYMNIHVGAAIDRRLTSPTFRPPQPNYLARVYTRMVSDAYRPNPPETALSPWTDPGQCWCAAASEPEGQSQLAVLLPRPVRARALVIEHIQSQGTWDIGSAPRHIEVWGIREKSEVYAPVNPAAKCNAGPPMDRNGEKPAPGHWMCLGTATYDVHAANAVQSFPLIRPRWPAGTVPPMIPESEMVSAVMVRIRSNWGAGYNCLYRVRLLGEGRDEILAEFGQKSGR